MDLTPQLLHDAEFREARRGGYDTRDVDEFLERVAVGIADVQERLRKAVERADAAEARAVAAERAAKEGGSSEAAELDETLKRTLVLAQRTADAAIKEAEEQAAQTLTSAREQAERLTADAQHQADAMKQQAEVEARRGADEARERALAEVAELNSAREVLQRDVDLLSAHFEAQRERLQTSIEALQRLLDEPTALADIPAPEVSDIAVEVVPVETAPPSIDLAGPEADDDAEPWADAPPAAFGTARPLRAGSGEQTEAIDLVGSEGRPLRAHDDIDPLAERDPGDEAYLAELRKAMTDESPLGPRDEEAGDPAARGAGGYDTSRVRRERSRFGRRS
jgi:DivIVA domain-containing protein